MSHLFPLDLKLQDNHFDWRHHDSCSSLTKDHVMTVCFFLLKEYTGNPTIFILAVICNFQIMHRHDAWLTDWHCYKLRVLNKFNLAVTALWMSNCVLQTMSGILLSHHTFTSSCAVTHFHHQMANSFSVTFCVTTSQVTNESWYDHEWQQQTT